MAVVSKLPREQWILTYENGGAPVPGVPAATYSFPAYYRISNSPLTFDSAEGFQISTPDGTYPQSSPYNVWSPLGDPNGTVMLALALIPRSSSTKLLAMLAHGKS
jgi:hypothetical protein